MRCFALLVGLLALGCDDGNTQPGEGGAPTNEGGAGDGGSSSADPVPLGGTPQPGPTAQIVPTITAATWTAKCGEPIPLDNIKGSVTIDYENVSEVPGWIMLTQADLNFPAGTNDDVFPAWLGNNYTGGLQPGEVSTQVHEQQKTTDYDTREICDWCNQQGTVRLVFELENFGMQTASFDFQLLCIP